MAEEKVTDIEKVSFFVGMVTPVIAVTVFVPFLLLEGVFFSTLWNWWVVPTFGVVHLNIVNAIGLSLVINFFKTNDPNRKFTWKNLVNSTLVDCFMLFIAWVLLFFK